MAIPCPRLTLLALSAALCASACNGEFQHNVGVEAWQQGHPEVAAKHYAKACDKGYGDSCYNLALLELEGDGVPQDFAAAYEHFERACAPTDLDACYYVAVLASEGRGTARDDAHANVLLDMGCERAHALSCELYGMRIHDGLGVQADPARGRETLDRACELGGEQSCNQAGILHWRADDLVRADIFFAKGCERDEDPTACFNLANGQGLPKSPEQIEALLAKACELGEPDACTANDPE